MYEDGANTARAEQEETDQALAVMAPTLFEKFTTMMETIPVADTEGAPERIVTAILTAETPEALDAPWQGHSLRELVGRVVLVVEIKRLSSDFTDGMGWYLGLDAVLVESGEKLYLTTGSLNCVTQLAVAHQRGMLPLQFVPRESERPSRRGFHPMHLEVVRARS